MAEVGVMKKLTIGGSTYTIPEYELPIASANTLGGIKVGTGLTINSTTGVLSATGASFDETDPIFVASAAHGITSSDISNWNSKTDTKVKLTEKTSSDSGQYPLIFGPDSDDIVSGTAYEGGYSDLCWEPNGHVLESNSGLIIQTGLETQIDMQPAGTRVAAFNANGFMSLGAANDTLGRLRFYNNTNNYYSVISAANITANKTLDIPNKSGTIAITSDIPTTIQSATTGITASTTATKTTLGTATSVTGVQSTTTTASKVTVGSHSTDYGVKSAGSGSFTQGSFSGGSFTQGTDSFTPNTPTVINTSKFNPGSYLHTGFSGGSGSFTQGSFDGGSFAQGVDMFTANEPTEIDESKFNPGSYSHSGFSGGSGSFTATVTNHVLSFSHSHTAADYGTDTYVAPSLDSGFYIPGSAAIFAQGIDEFTPATHDEDLHTHIAAVYGTDSFTAPSLSSGFYTAGTAASFIQGTDSFTPATHGADSHTHTAPTLGSKVPTVSASDVTVPIKNSSSTSIPNVSVTSATVTITDTGHTHTLS